MPIENNYIHILEQNKNKNLPILISSGSFKISDVLIHVRRKNETKR